MTETSSSTQKMTTVCYNDGHITEPFKSDPIDATALTENIHNIIEKSVDDNALPTLGSLQATTQKNVMRDLVKWYSLYKKCGYSTGEARLRAQNRIRDEEGITEQNFHTYYARISPSSIEQPTAWFTDQLSEFWQWYLGRYNTSFHPELDESVCRLRGALQALQELPTPELSAEDFTVGDLLNAGDEHILRQSSIGIQFDSSNQPIEQARLRIHQPDGPSVRLFDLTKYSVPWSKSWKQVLGIMDDNLRRYSKEDNAASLNNEYDCAEAYARWPPYREEAENPLVTLEARYYGSGKMRTSAQIWPGREDKKRVSLIPGGTDFSNAAIDQFFIKSIETIERMD